MLKVIHLGILCALFASSTTTSIMDKEGSQYSSCPCANVSYCNPIATPSRREVVGFGVRLDYYKQFDWNKMTTLIITEHVLIKVGVEIVCYAHQHDTRVLIATAISKNDLKSAVARTAVVQRYLALVRKYYMDGANIDVEILTPEPDVSKGLTAYVKETSETHKAANPHALVVTDVPWLPDLYQGHNTWALAQYSDFLFIMAYDEISQLPPCIAEANAPLSRTEKGATLFKDIGISGDKLVLALPWYGYSYKCSLYFGGNRCIGMPDGLNCKMVPKDYGTVSQMLPRSIDGEHWSNTYSSPFMNMKTSGGIEQTWYDNARSLKLKYSIADRLQLRGVGLFCVDYLNYANPFDPTTKQMWDAVPQYN